MACCRVITLSGGGGRGWHKQSCDNQIIETPNNLESDCIIPFDPPLKYCSGITIVLQTN